MMQTAVLPETVRQNTACTLMRQLILTSRRHGTQSFFTNWYELVDVTEHSHSLQIGMN